MKETRYVRFDWAIKRLLRHKADFVVVEGFLSSLLDEPVKIVKALESEGNRESADDKTNRVDVLVVDAKGRKIIIEIQNDFQAGFFHRMLYGTSKLVTEYLSQGDEYGQIGKVYSVNIVYFPLGEGKDYVYRGRTEFRGIHTHDTLGLNAEQRAAFGREEAGELYPEYFILRVNQFDKVAKTPLDQWVHFLKTEEIPERFAAPGLAEARERLVESKLAPEDRAAYDRAVHYRRIEDDEIKTAFVRGRMQGAEEGRAEGEAKGRVEGEARGRIEGEANAKRAVARGMLGLGLSIEQVSAVTKLPEDELARLKEAK
ncbi:MAG: Rpn family recombination-promoting nuclease/putative transposase [Verrucomicrobiota bacterium]|jgi:predicted transposase/invertase (TIGR01784 family)|nr:Rpn family recombination-promoting nuclease/putative transposase [Verrucomicrobiota bacterium]